MRFSKCDAAYFVRQVLTLRKNIALTFPCRNYKSVRSQNIAMLLLILVRTSNPTQPSSVQRQQIRVSEVPTLKMEAVDSYYTLVSINYRASDPNTLQPPRNFKLYISGKLMYKKRQRSFSISWERQEERDHYQNLEVGGRTILRWISEK